MTLSLDPVELRDLSTAELLASGGDSRHTPGASGRNRYGNTYTPERGLLTFGSCTSSTLSADAFAAAERLHGWLGALERPLLERALDDLYERVRTEIVANVSMTNAETMDVVITPSGTDAELIALLVCMGDRPITSVVVGAPEAGSGTALAAAGRHFDSSTPSGRPAVVGEPVDARIADRVRAIFVAVRDTHGSPRDERELDDEVRAVTGKAIAEGRDVLLHVIAHSKTGVHAPSLSTVHELVAAHPDRVDVVIDAAQGRFSRRGLRESLARGYVTMTTGSKFFGGPPFAGAVLVPHVPGRRDLGIDTLPAAFSDYFTPAMMPQSWLGARASLEESSNVGLLLRWWAALAEIRDYYSVPAQLRLEVLRHVQTTFPARIAASRHLVLDVVPPPLVENDVARLLESKTTVFPFTCRGRDGSYLESDELRRLQLAMRDPIAPMPGGPPVAAAIAGLRAEMGQPVSLGGASSPSVLRFAVGAREIIRTCVMSATGTTFGDRLDALTDDITHAVQKLDHLVAQAGGERSES
jgi:hypothetical protein